jgi:hypothetical protein
MAPPAESPHPIAALFGICILFPFAYFGRGGRKSIENLAQKHILKEF